MTTATTSKTDRNPLKSGLGTCIKTYSGRTKGPHYGEAYTAPEGEQGYISGYRSTHSEGLGLMSRQHHATADEATQRACELTS